MERKIGEIFEYNGEWYQCLKGISCKECDFSSNSITCDIHGAIACMRKGRSDDTSVVFKKLKKIGEPYTIFMDKNVQNYLLETAVSVPPKDGFTLINNEQRLIAIEIKQIKENMGGVTMANICKNNIFRLFIGCLLRIAEEGELKAVMQSLHGWSDEEYREYLNIFIEKWNDIPDDTLTEEE